MSIRLTLAPALLAGLLAASPVLAQAPAPTPAPTPATAAAANAHRDSVVEHRITELHGKLKITAAEEKPFGDFAQAMRDNAHGMDEALGKHQASVATASAVDQMKAYADVAQAHAEQVNHLVAPFSMLYDALSPEQKKLADQSFRDFANGPRGVRAVRG